MFTDTHCHLNFKAFDADLDAVIQRAKEAGVNRIIIPGAKIDSSQRAVEIAGQYEGCYAAVGIHPHHVTESVKIEDIPLLRSLATNIEVVAIGEIGLDRYAYKNYPPVTEESITTQKELLRLQLALAHEHNLPVILHCRGAQQNLLTVLTQFQQEHKTHLRGVFHCFDGDEAYLRWVLSLGFYVGFDGNSTYPSNTHLRALIQQTPLDRLLLETDAPYLTPVPHRGQRNEPAYVPIIAQLVADIHNKPIEYIAQITTKNASTLFKLPL